MRDIWKIRQTNPFSNRSNPAATRTLASTNNVKPVRDGFEIVPPTQEFDHDIQAILRKLNIHIREQRRQIEARNLRIQQLTEELEQARNVHD